MVWSKWPFGSKGNDESSQNNENLPEQQSKSFFHSYSSSRSRTCKPDIEDANYMICKDKVRDGNNSYETEERVPIKQSSSTFTTSNHFNMDVNLDKSFQDMFSEMDRQFTTIPFFGNFFSPFFNDMRQDFPFHHNHPENYFPRQHQSGYEQQSNQSSNNSRQGNSKYFFTGNGERDFSVKDL